MTQAVRRRHNPLSALINDGKAHPVENSLTLLTLALGLVAAITAAWEGLNVISSCTGLVGVLTGAWGQFISATTGERFVLIIGLGAAAFGLYLGLAHGGFVA
jgi:uncharacterized membrane protein YgaE (UPF0421/DUF939 family)